MTFNTVLLLTCHFVGVDNSDDFHVTFLDLLTVATSRAKIERMKTSKTMYK